MWNSSGCLETCRLHVRSGWRLPGGHEPVCCSLGTCAASGSDPTLRPAQCASDLSCHLDSSVSTMILEDVMWRSETYVSDLSHQNATRIIYSH
jgi:hypothetical protein